MTDSSTQTTEQTGLIPPGIPFEQWDPTDCRYLTADAPGIGGTLKNRPDDFLVDEIPAYEPSGAGDHVYLIIEKRNRTTSDAVRLLSQHFGVPMKSVGYAGLKDKHAITRQTLSMEHVDEDLAGTFQDEGITILGVSRHTNKIKRGHLRGNRFVIKIRDVDPLAVVRARTIMARLEGEGVPNFFGEQRFGYRHNGHLLGRMLLREDWQGFCDVLLGGHDPNEPARNSEARAAYDAGNYPAALETWNTSHRFERQAVGTLSRGGPPADAVNAIDQAHRGLLVSAFQSALFNYLLNDRLARGLFDRLLTGDIAQRHDSRGIFHVRDAEVEQPRCARLEISPTGPMWGRAMQRPESPVADWERAVLDWSGITPEDFETGIYQPEGTRRSFRMALTDPEIGGGVDEHGPHVRCAFDLPRGCYATVVLREIMKNDMPLDEATNGEED